MSQSDIALQDCPFPEVAHSLKPYIKTRQEVDIIRNALQAKLPTSSVNASVPVYHGNIESASVTGVHKAYLRALQAHQAAQARYESLKAEIDQLALNGPSNLNSTSENDAFIPESYIPFMRQREKHRKLKVVQGTLVKVDAAGGKAITESFDKVTRRQVGDLPVPPPSAAFAERDAGSDSEYDLTRLKKAILAVRHQLDEHDTATVQANGILNGGANPHAELYALKKAHNELTAWMEQQLAMISDLEAPKEGSDEAPLPDKANGEVGYSMQDIESLYEQYLDARERLLDGVANSTRGAASTPSSPEVIRGPSTWPEADQTQTPAEALLPYLSRLVSMRQAERDLLQQSAHVRRRLNTAETRTHEVLDRLANESRLVQPELRNGASLGSVWKKASAEANASTADTANQRLQSGQAAAENASASLDTIQNMPKSWDALLI